MIHTLLPYIYHHTCCTHPFESSETRSRGKTKINGHLSISLTWSCAIHTKQTTTGANKKTMSFSLGRGTAMCAIHNIRCEFLTDREELHEYFICRLWLDGNSPQFHNAIICCSELNDSKSEHLNECKTDIDGTEFNYHDFIHLSDDKVRLVVEREADNLLAKSYLKLFPLYWCTFQFACLIA